MLSVEQCGTVQGNGRDMYAYMYVAASHHDHVSDIRDVRPRPDAALLETGCKVVPKGSKRVQTNHEGIQRTAAKAA